MSTPLRKGILSLRNGKLPRQIKSILSRNNNNIRYNTLRCSSAYNTSDKGSQARRTSHFQQVTRNATIQSSTAPVISPDYIIRSRIDDIDIPNLSLAEYTLSKLSSHSQESTAVVNGVTGQTFSYGQLKESIIKVASALTKLGYKKGDTFCLFSPNNPEFCIMFVAISAIGGIITTANPFYSTSELSRQIEHSKAVAVITIDTTVDLVKEASASQPTVKEIFVIGEAKGCRPVSSLMEDDGKSFPENVDIDPVNDVVALPYSSGTTGLPKGVMLSHRNIVSNVVQVGMSVPMYNSDTIIGILPLFHIYGMVIVQFGTFRDGGSLITLPKFDPKEFLETLEKYKVSVAPIVPPIGLFLSKHSSVDDYDLSHLRLIISGAAPFVESSQMELSERLHVKDVLQGYGLTECSPVSHTDTSPPTHGTIGTCVVNTEAKVVDVETGELLGPGEVGELCVRGPQVMLGYLNNEEATDDTIRDGWLHTGDICHYDESGCFTVADRLKELIKYKGFQVPPAELEGLLVSHHEIGDAAVIGVPDDMAGELPKAFIVLAPDSKLTEEDISNFVNEHVSPHKRLRGGVQFVSEIPKSASGKILRRMLRDSL